MSSSDCNPLTSIPPITMEGILEVDVVVVVVCALLIVEKKSTVALIIEIVFMTFILKLPDKGVALNQPNQTENCTLKIGSCDFPYWNYIKKKDEHKRLVFSY
jgi:hypothetical protein